MEYLLNSVRNKRGCENFLSQNHQLIQDVFNNNVPEIYPAINISEIINVSNEYTKWRYYCYSNPKLFLSVSLDKKLKGEYLFKYEIDVSDKQLEYIELQINFFRMGFNDFKNYIIKNKEKYKSVKLVPFKNSEKNHKLEIGIGEESNGNFFKSTNFYELIESSKIFFNPKNWDIFEKQLSFSFGNETQKIIRNFFKLKFLKFYLYKKVSLINQEFILLSGSFLLFSMGFRSSRDIDIYSLEYDGAKTINNIPFHCDLNVNFIGKNDKDYKNWYEIIMNPKEYCFLFGFKTNLLEVELLKRLGRIGSLKSHKALADFLVLKYFMGLNTKMNLSNEKDIENLLFFRYRNFDRKAIKKFFQQK